MMFGALLIDSSLQLQLSLAGNVFEKVSPHVFFPTSQLTELDLSDCDLKQIWSDEPKQNMLPSLRSLNISNNEMKTLYLSEISVSLWSRALLAGVVAAYIISLSFTRSSCRRWPCWICRRIR